MNDVGDATISEGDSTLQRAARRSSIAKLLPRVVPDILSRYSIRHAGDIILINILFQTYYVCARTHDSRECQNGEVNLSRSSQNVHLNKLYFNDFFYSRGYLSRHSTALFPSLSLSFFLRRPLNDKLSSAGATYARNFQLRFTYFSLLFFFLVSLSAPRARTTNGAHRVRTAGRRVSSTNTPCSQDITRN